MIEQFIAPISAYPYLALFVGMLIGGETVFLPAIFLALAGNLNTALVLGIATMGTLVSDVFWYYVGRTLTLSKIRTWKIFAGKQDSFDKMGALFKEKSSFIIYISKFIYGTRIVVQILAGYHKVRFGKYILINLLGIISLFGLITTIGITVSKTLVVFKDVLYVAQIGFAIFVIIAVLVQIWIKKILTKKFHL